MRFVLLLLGLLGCLAPAQAYPSKGLSAPVGVFYRPPSEGASLVMKHAPVRTSLLGASRPALGAAAIRDPLAGPALPTLSLAAADSLPEGMPLHTRLLWGRSGVLRGLGVGPSTRQGELRLRAGMLQWHQRMGLLTFGVLTTQVVLGELMARDPAKHYEDLQPIHRPLGYTAFGVYLTTASLSLFAPPARRYGSGFSSIRLHRWLAVVHLTGMLVQPWLGRSLSQASAEQYDDRLTRHRWVGRVTLGAFTMAMFSTFLPY